MGIFRVKISVYAGLRPHAIQRGWCQDPSNAAKRTDGQAQTSPFYWRTLLWLMVLAETPAIKPAYLRATADGVLSNRRAR
jgi:hypothetical protein